MNKKRIHTGLRRGLAALIALFCLAQSALAVSIWAEGQGSGYFAAAKRNFKVGDIVFIKIDEVTRADHQWKAERDKEWKVDATADPTGNGGGTHNLFGLWLPFMNMDYKSEFSSDNNSDRMININAKVAAEVVNVMPNGYLQIVARKVTRVNSEEQLIELTGNVRPDDITAQNTVSSTLIADATIKVNGTMRFMNDKKPSILERILSFVFGTLS